MKLNSSHKAVLICYIIPLLLVFVLLYMYNFAEEEQPKVGTAIGVQNVYTDQRGISDEAKELVDDLRMKHYGLATFYCSDAMIADFVYDWWSMTFEDGILYVETQGGEWFIEMERKGETD